MSITFRGPDNFSVPINNIGLYSDGVPMVKTDQFDEICRKADTVVVKARDLNEFVVAMFLIDSFDAKSQGLGLGITRAVVPYLPGARQDRINPTGDVLFTSTSVADMLGSRGLIVITIDPHSPASVNSILEFDGLPVEYPLERVAALFNASNYDGIIAPDKGAKDRAEKFAVVMGLPITYASKTRDVSTGKLSGFEVDVEADRHYLVVDDICDGGGTFVGLGEQIVKQGATASLYVTHGIFSKGTNELEKYYTNIITTDSRDAVVRHQCVQYLPVVEDMINYA